MAGVYIHIPFCRQACRYCDFHFTVSLSQKNEIIKAIGKEIILRSDYTAGEEIKTIYFGGGTPSVLEPGEIQFLLDIIRKQNICDDLEISFEANPDDLTEGFLKSLASLGINRLSIGVQSFFEEDLALMRRSHNVKQAYDSIERACVLGFGNISIDLIYGIPGMDLKRWEKNIRIAMAFGIPHISAYHLTYEAGTVFDHWRKKGRLMPVQEEESINQFRSLRKMTGEFGYEHYEISNFAKEGYISQHNVNYWKQVSYIGVGPSAHSYNGYSRRWNISSNKKYYEGIMNDTIFYEEETLSEDNLYNEYIMTSLRTIWGVDGDYILQKFGKKRSGHFNGNIRKYIDNGTVVYPVKFTITTFKPDVEDIVICKVNAVTKSGFFCQLGPLEIFVPHTHIPDTYKYELGEVNEENKYVGKETTIMSGEYVRVKLCAIQKMDIEQIFQSLSIDESQRQKSP